MDLEVGEERERGDLGDDVRREIVGLVDGRKRGRYLLSLRRMCRMLGLMVGRGVWWSVGFRYH